MPLNPAVAAMIDSKRAIIQSVTQHHMSKRQEAQALLEDRGGQEGGRNEGGGRMLVDLPVRQRAASQRRNAGVGDTQVMLFDKKFKNYLNHKGEFREEARQKQQQIIHQRRQLAGADYFNAEEVLSNTDGDLQYSDAEDMNAACQQLLTGKKPKGGTAVSLFQAEKFQNKFRKRLFDRITSLGDGLLSKNLLLEYLYQEPAILMLYNVNPYLLGDELAEIETATLDYLTFEQFSAYLLASRPIFESDYSTEVLEEARKLGRGLKCAPILAKWLHEELLVTLLEIYRDVDLLGDSQVERAFLARKIRKQCGAQLALPVIQVVNIGKCLSLQRILYELEFSIAHPCISALQFDHYLRNYARLPTPSKDKLLTKLIMSGNHDSSYIYILSQEVLQFLKEVFALLPKFAEYFVVKEHYLERLVKDARYSKMRNVAVRPESNKYVERETVEETLMRMYSEADLYIDIEEVLDFFTNRGRPFDVEHAVYLSNLERQIKTVEAEPVESEDEEYDEVIKKRKRERKISQLHKMKSGNAFAADVRFQVTVPKGFEFMSREKQVTIADKKLKETLEEKRRQEREAAVPVKCKDVPWFVKQPLYEQMLKDHDRERKERLEKFRLQILSKVVEVSDRLIRPKQSPERQKVEGFKFVARPMPWYCEVNLLKRIEDKKAERRERILEEIIDKHSCFTLPPAIIQMEERHTAIQEKRAAAKTASTEALSFRPTISHHVPDFKSLHEQLHFDLQNAKDQKKPVEVQVFSFENRPSRARTTYHKQQHQIAKPRPHAYSKAEQVSVPVAKPTKKFQDLVKMRRSQEKHRQEQLEKEQKAETLRKMRQTKFGPIVRKAMKKGEAGLTNSRTMIEERIKEFKLEERRKKMEYQEQMIRIYTKVFNRPLLVEGERESKGKGRASRPEETHHGREVHNYDQGRRDEVDHHPGQYLEEEDESREYDNYLENNGNHTS